MKAGEGRSRLLRRRLCAVGLLVMLGAALSACAAAPAASSATFCDQHPADTRC